MDENVEELVQELKHSDDRVRRQEIVRALGELGDARAVNSLIAVLQDYGRDWDVRSLIEDALSKIGSEHPQVLERLIQVLGSRPATHVSACVAHAIVNLSDGKAPRSLVRLLKHDDPGMRDVVLGLLYEIGDILAIWDVADLRKDPVQHVRYAAEEAFEGLLGRAYRMLGK